MNFVKNLFLLACILSVLPLTGCVTRPGRITERKGDEIMVAGKLVHTGTRVVLWTDPGGYDAYRVERRFSPIEESDWETSKAAVEYLRSPARYNLRKGDLTPEEIERVRGGGWDIETLQRVVDQFVIHFDVAGTSCTCFKVLHDGRGLSVHFLLDVDGTIYQTLDAKERAFHATTSNDRSVGIEIANMGAYGMNEKNPFHEWYQKKNGQTLMTVPDRFKPETILRKDVVLQPARPEPIVGEIQGRTVMQYCHSLQSFSEN
jgi:N-acetylmuramoyl-L-alanine amidase